MTARMPCPQQQGLSWSAYQGLRLRTQQETMCPLTESLGEIRKTTGSCVQVPIIVITLPSDHGDCSPHTILLVHIKGTKVARMWTQETFLYCWWEYKLVQRPRNSVWNLIEPINRDLPCDPAGPLPCIHWKDSQLHVLHRDAHITVCDRTLFTIAKFWRQYWCPTIEEWIRKHTEICVCREKWTPSEKSLPST